MSQADKKCQTVETSRRAGSLSVWLLSRSSDRAAARALSSDCQFPCGPEFETVAAQVAYVEKWKGGICENRGDKHNPRCEGAKKIKKTLSKPKYPSQPEICEEHKGLILLQKPFLPSWGEIESC